MNKIVFISGESGCGKSTLQSKLIDLYPDKFSRIMSTTTRESREGEGGGLDYNFINNVEFNYMATQGQFLQNAKFGDTQYGTLISEYEREQEIGVHVCTPVGIIDTINGFRKLGIDLSYQYHIIYFMVTDSLLKEHGVDKDRLERGNIREDFMERYNKGEFYGIDVTFITDSSINELLYHKVISILTENNLDWNTRRII